MDKQELQELIKASKQVFLARSSNGKKPLKEEKQTQLNLHLRPQRPLKI